VGWTDLSPSADGEYASVAYKGAREVWNLKTGKPVLVLKPNEPKPDTSSADSDQSDSPAESAGLQPRVLMAMTLSFVVSRPVP
jgi:hypothetical protein